jgi:predicted nucleic acid-binding protein
MKVYLDTNVVLDLLLERHPSFAATRSIAQAASDGQISACIGATTITNIYYISK